MGWMKARAEHSALSRLAAPLQERIDRLPRQPGVYLLKDHDEVIIYVGKAKSLYARVRSYFTSSGDDRAFVPLLLHVLGDVEVIVTANEKEALLLENNLIKKHHPRFNVMMRDDKNFLVLKLDLKQRFPRLLVERRIKDDGARYFGPYHRASACRETLRIVNRYFRLRTCTDRVMASRSRPCLQYQIGRCPAPCVYDVSEEEYGRQIEDVSLFLRGRHKELIVALAGRMEQAAQVENFELAAALRDQLRAVEGTLQSQQVVGSDLLDQDVFALYREGEAVEIAVLNLRGGKLLGSRTFSFGGQSFPTAELLSSFIGQYYDGGAEVPAQVLVQQQLEDAAIKAEWLADLAGRRVELLVPQRGNKNKLVKLAQRNAESTFLSRRQRDEDAERALAKLQRRLRLHALPRHMECYDISQLLGTDVVASMVVMRDAESDPSSYRHFKVQRATDDFAAIYEVIARRLRRARKGDRGWELPQLMVVDGGKGQLSSALAALRDADLAGAGLAEPEIISLAKERYGPDAEGDDRPDRVFLPHVKDAVRLRSNTSELFLLSRLRDEAHRFAITHHKKLRQKRAFRSSLDEIPGVGKKRKTQLLRHLGSLKRIRTASVEELNAVPGMSRKAAEAVVGYFARAKDPGSSS